MNILIYIIVGIISGWLAGELITGSGFGLIGNLIVGLLGAFVGGLLMDALGKDRVPENMGVLASIVVSTIGAMIMLVVLNFIF